MNLEKTKAQTDMNTEPKTAGEALYRAQGGAEITQPDCELEAAAVIAWHEAHKPSPWRPITEAPESADLDQVGNAIVIFPDGRAGLRAWDCIKGSGAIGWMPVPKPPIPPDPFETWWEKWRVMPGVGALKEATRAAYLAGKEGKP